MGSPSNIILQTRNGIGMTLRNRDIAFSPIRTERYANSFYSCTIKEWKHFSNEVKSKPSIQSFKKYLNDFKRPVGNSVFGIRDKFEIKLLTKIRVNFSELRDHRFNHNLLLWYRG